MEDNVILGTYTGECADANITNANGLDITREVWETVFNSEEYKIALKNSWYLGYLGHPEDPNCMDFKDACIVMREGHIDDNGKVYGTFDLVDTPVGRVVDAFQKAGVTFGISVRGAGEIYDNSVDPESFVFRGFDLVSFPAYPEAIPEFTRIAASSDIETQRKYKTVCAAVAKNAKDISSVSTVDTLQKFFAKQSNEYATLQKRKEDIMSSTHPDTALIQQKLEGMTNLYADEHAKSMKLQAEVTMLRRRIAAATSTNRRKIKSIQRISAAQNAELDKRLAAVTARGDALSRQNKKLIVANTKLRSENNNISTANEDLKSKNLKYYQEVKANTQILSDKDAQLSKLRSQLDETVVERKSAEGKSSNLGAKLADLKTQLQASQQLIEEYQNAYATIYANAVGTNLNNISITATTSVSELQSLINRSATVECSYTEADEEEALDEAEWLDISDSDNELVTL